MATQEAIARMREGALHRLEHTMQTIADTVGVAPAPLPPRQRDPHYQHAVTLIALADWMDALARTLMTEPDEGEEEARDGRRPTAKTKH